MSVTTIIVTTVVGALIGGITNTIAIKMLFHPYEAKYLFGKRIPLTPGVVPMRRKEASKKLGNIITEYLLTPDVFVEKLKSKESEKFIDLFIDKQIEIIEKENISISDLLNKVSPNLRHKILEFLYYEIDTKVKNSSDELMFRTIESLLPEDAKEKLDNEVSTLHLTLNERIISYLTSDKGYNDIYTMIDDFIENRGKLERAIKYVVPKDTLATRVQGELVQLLGNEDMKNIERDFILREYESLIKQTPSSYISSIDQEKITSRASSIFKQKINVEELLDRPIHLLNKNLFDSLKSSGKIRLRENIIHYLGKHIPGIVQNLHLAEVITRQIDSFDIEKLEFLVFEVARNELKMIMLLGYVLGGFVGFIQGIVVPYIV
ncbi:DUF445 family protein [Nosocomiicoccus ampullae]|uniref:Uncharacterized membrane protein YheB (UPF0754 family) n=1 Tax=Nosocomiicoccus ampullae TaxID=489910 RepID=A0A9Q2HDN9_9STAP|nr:DUF445 family protein [Nosocomiicoccus ampullae]MBB5175153.1 uncharacterized membrane protein YheB (UPF0754 family) [Nosocomiicoccus ampullae]QYA46467.1 DUF445 family protein [Nosocomiicoccus ampullae]